MTGGQISTQAPSLLNPIDALLNHGTSEALLFAVFLLAAVSILYFTVRTGVPPMPSHPSSRKAQFRLISEEPAPSKIYELGCGWGGFAFELAARYPDARVVGIEISPFPWLFCHMRRYFQKRPNLEIRRADFLRCDLSDGDLVLCYLMAAPMRPLERKLTRDLRPGSLVITNTFAFPDWVADKVETVPKAMNTKIYQYRIPG